MRQQRRRLVIGAGCAVVLAVVVALLAGDQGVVALYRTWRQMGSLNEELNTSRRTIDSLKIEIQRLKNDTAYIERIAREKYGMARENEKMFKFVEGK
jgi:cell division protein FtsB